MNQFSRENLRISSPDPRRLSKRLTCREDRLGIRPDGHQVLHREDTMIQAARHAIVTRRDRYPVDRGGPVG